MMISMSFQLATTADTKTILKLMPIYYEFDHLIFNEAKARKTLTEFLSNENFGRLWLLLDEKTSAAIGYIIITFGYSFECGGKEALSTNCSCSTHIVEEELTQKRFGTPKENAKNWACRQCVSKSLKLIWM